MIFDQPYNLFQLKEILRQKKDSEIVDYYTHIRNNLLTDTTFSPKKGIDVVIYSNKEDFEIKMKEEFLNETTRFNKCVIVYTNLAVNHYNRLIRRSLGFKKQFVVYDLLVGYEKRRAGSSV